MDHPSSWFLLFLVSFLLGIGLAWIVSDDRAERAMTCIVNQQQASSTDPIANCSKILGIYQKSNDN